LSEKVRQWSKHKLIHVEKEIQTNGNQLQLDLATWCNPQTQLMPILGDMVTALPPLEIHNETLFFAF